MSRDGTQSDFACDFAMTSTTERLIAQAWSGDGPMDERVTQETFCLEEATIDDLHDAIRAGRTTCVDVVQHYLARVRAFNGVASLLVTADGAPVASATGTVRGGAPLAFPTETVQASSFLP